MQKFEDTFKDRVGVIGVGASAGGLEALRDLIQHLEKLSHFSIVVAQHLAPKYRSMMAELLRRETNLDVREAQPQVTLEPGVIYIAPPNRNILVKNRALVLESIPKSQIGPKPSIDRLFYSIADEYGEDAIAIVLSGTGSDGSLGVRAVKSAGGITIAQDTKTAKYDGMPIAARDTGTVDLVLSPKKIAQHLIQLNASYKNVDDGIKIKQSAFKDILAEVRKHTGLDFQPYKSSTIYRRIHRRMLAHRFQTVEEYADRLKSDPDEIQKLTQSFLISVTSFFRDTESYVKILALIKHIIQSKEPNDEIRVWISGCASGEEAYSLAVLFSEALGTNPKHLALQIFATDIDEVALEIGRRGYYSENIVGPLPKKYRDRYFSRKGKHFIASKKLREMVVFARHDLTRDPPFLKLDFISCRNVLIYFSPALQKRVFDVFSYALRPKGWLWLGKSESVWQATELFEDVDSHHKIFRRRDFAPRALPRAAMPRPKTRQVPKASTDQKMLESEVSGWEEVAHRALLDYGTDPAILVDAVWKIEHIHGEVKPFLTIKPGKPNLTLLNLVPKQMATELISLSQKARKSLHAEASPPRDYSIRDTAAVTERLGESLIRLIVIPLSKSGVPSHMSAGDYYLVIFRRVEISAVQSAATKKEWRTLRIKELEREVLSSQQHLETVIEELQTSNEELQSVNEELHATNEELQSTNEELETSNEELQSTNEELRTVNEELSVKSQELTTAYSDLENVLNSIDFPLIVFDKSLRIHRMNASARKVLPMFWEHFNTAITEIELPSSLNEISQILDTTIRTQQKFERTLEWDQKNFLLRVLPSFNALNVINGAILTMVEITVRVNHERLIERQRAQLVKSAKMAGLGEMAAGIAHEINNPLSVLLNEIELTRELAARGKLTEERYLKAIERSFHISQRMSKIVSGLKAIARDGSHDPFEVIPMAALLDETQAICRTPADRAPLELTFVPVPPEWVIECQAVQISQVLVNLIANAIDATEGQDPRWVRVSVTLHANFYHILVEDSGSGPNSDVQKRMMEPFFTTKPVGKGTGLGLSVSKGIIEFHNGKLYFDSAHEHSTFVVELPATQSLRS